MRDCFAPNFSSFGRVKVEDSEHMWHFVKALGRSQVSVPSQTRVLNEQRAEFTADRGDSRDQCR